MNCIAIDDEPLALDIIREFCQKTSYLNLIDVFTNPLDAVKVLNKNNVDLIFLDIHMPNISGLEFLETLHNPPMVIITTAFTEHAILGFEKDVVDYLLKPFSFERFIKSVNKAYELFTLRNNTVEVKDIEKKNEGSSGFLMIKVEYRTIRVNLDDIQYIEGLKDYVKIFVDKKPFLTKTTMKNLEEKLPSHLFSRVHKSFIVSVSKIDSIENNRIIIGKQLIPIGELYKTAFYELIDKNRI
jgi:DNA-binding LytR/AlgR family response regulator